VYVAGQQTRQEKEVAGASKSPVLTNFILMFSMQSWCQCLFL